MFKIEYKQANQGGEDSQRQHLWSDSDKFTVDKARKAIENRSRIPQESMRNQLTGFVKCCKWTRRDKLMARGLKIVESEMDIERVLKRQRSHNTALKALMNEN